MDKYKKQLKEITTETKLSNNEFQNKVVNKILKDANVKIKDKNFENVLSIFTSDGKATK
ncbi:foldase PrsA domain protein [Klebsiella michiganensis]|uniref:foldase PrsA domain protein n=1 Tax=Klebsiella michiganensis TaxID=1134687 RepID=UPI0010B752A2|nr:foldase PrsA domain protein [Enterococcus faecium]BBI25696.1 peptidylprolyl isomerase [Enterococcus faecium]